MIEMKLLFFIGAVLWQATNSNAVIPVNTVIRSVNTFSNKIVKAIAEDASSNLVCSPISANMVLSMATYGARGNTEKVLRSALALTADDAVTKNGFQSLVDRLTYSKSFDLRMANKIFLADGFVPSADFRDVTETAFRSPAQSVNFRNPSDASKIINDWCNVQTNYHIKDLVKSDDLKDDTALVLVNAVYFKADWEDQFPASRTKSKLFHVHGKSVKDVVTMWNFGVYKYGELPDVKAKFIEIPYKSARFFDAVSMFIILPDEIDGLGELVKDLEKVTVERLLRGKKHTVRVSLPKFKIESTIDLETPLGKLGLAEIFSDTANFSGIVESPPLKVGKIVQKAFIEVNEKGTEAAAATKLKILNRSGFPGVKYDPFDFTVDHPFVAVIATKQGVPLFSSVVVDPIY